MNNILSIQQVGVSFGGIRALNDVSFNVERGSITAIIGPNGAGKTTMFNCITGFYRTTDGKINFQSKSHNYSVDEILGQKLHPVDFLNPFTLGRKLFYKLFGGSHQVASLGIARTFQNIRLFKDMTTVENLLVAQHRTLNKNIFSSVFRLKGFKESEDRAVKKALKWLEIVGLSDEKTRLAGELPYGHQRRLEIARAMCTGAELVCLDEPAAGLNHNETAELSALIRKLRDEFQVTVCVIEHDMSLVMDVSDRIVVLDHGEVIAEGKPDEVRNDPKVLKAYLGEE